MMFASLAQSNLSSLAPWLLFLSLVLSVQMGVLIFFFINSLPAASYLILTSQVNEISHNDLSILTLEPIKSHF